MESRFRALNRYGEILAVAGGIVVLYIVSFYNYLIFHSLSEIFSIVIACGIFFFAWNARQFLENDYFLFLGIGYVFIGGIDLLHTLSYKGVGVFEGYGANLPTQLWIAARYMESLTLLAAPLLLSRFWKAKYMAIVYLMATLGLLLAIFKWKIFPDCFIEGKGLTPFKKISEYIIAFILVGSIIYLVQMREEFEDNVFKLMVTSILLTIGAELAFTFYISVYGFSNLIGHFLKIVSFYLIYKAVIETGLSKPYSILLRNLKQSEEELQSEKGRLQSALDDVKTFRGLLPICSHCKKIRDDKGYWNQIESYFRDHSEAEFSHSICPECRKTLYPHLKAKEKAEKINQPESAAVEKWKQYQDMERRSGKDRRGGISRRTDVDQRNGQDRRTDNT